MALWGPARFRPLWHPAPWGPASGTLGSGIRHLGVRHPAPCGPASGTLGSGIRHLGVRHPAPWGPASGTLGSGIRHLGVRVLRRIFPQVSDTELFIEIGFGPRLLDPVRQNE